MLPPALQAWAEAICPPSLHHLTPEALSRPLSVRILGLDFSVHVRSLEQDPDLNGSHGYCDHVHNFIVLKDSNSEGRNKETLLHETLHALSDALHAGLSEEQVSLMARGLLAVIRENVEVMTWLQE